jgi:hypothetical protein
MAGTPMTIAPGALVRIRQFGDIAFVVHRKDTFHPRRWHCVSKAVDGRYRILHSGQSAGEGDIVVVREAPSYAPGEEVRFNGAITEVIVDHGDTVELAIPPSRFKTRAGDHLALAPSRATVDKSDLVLESLGRPLPH